MTLPTHPQNPTWRAWLEEHTSPVATTTDLAELLDRRSSGNGTTRVYVQSSRRQ